MLLHLAGMELSGLEKYCGANLGGLKTIQYAPIHWINASILIDLVTDENNFLYTIPFSTGSWLSLPILPSEDIWIENNNLAPSSPTFTQEITTIVPKLRPEASIELEAMSNMRFIVRLTDKHDQEWLIGDPRVGLSFNYRATSGSTNGLNSYSIGFSGITGRPSPGYMTQAITPS
jgi:hypothetical protein